MLGMCVYQYNYVFLSFELTSIPRSLGNSDDAKLENKKAELLQLLREMAIDGYVPVQAIVIIDAVAQLHQLCSVASTYHELAIQILCMNIKGTG